MSDDNEHLSAAISALGDIMLEMQRRKLLARTGASAKTRELLSAKSMTDEQIGDIAAKSFEAGAMELARRGHPGATVFSCNPSERPSGPCDHARTERGKNVPRVYGSWRSEICLDCGAFRTHGHDPGRSHLSAWHPASQYAEATAEPEDH